MSLRGCHLDAVSLRLSLDAVSYRLSLEAVSYRLSFEGCLLETVQICTASQVERIECRLL